MLDREKVIRAVETCFDSWIDKHRNMGLVLDGVERMKRDALELLKEQEPVSPIPYQQDTSIGFFAGFKCGGCNAEVFPDYRFCPMCGKAVKWE